MIVCDVSFISLSLVLPPVLALAAPQAEAAFLIKPQFEAGPDHVKKGFVRDAKSRARRFAKRSRAGRGHWAGTCRRHSSPISGGDGNQQIFYWERAARDRPQRSPDN